MGKPKYICIYGSYEQELAAYSYSQIGRMVMALLHLLNTGEGYEPKGAERYIWPSLLGQFERDRETYDAICAKNRRNSAKGVQARRDRAVTERLPLAPKEKEKEKENEKEKEKENAKENEREEGEAGCNAVQCGFPPEISEVVLFCEQAGLRHVDPYRFCRHFAALNWVYNGAPLLEWKSLVKAWDEKDKKRIGEVSFGSTNHFAGTKYGTVL